MIKAQGVQVWTKRGWINVENLVVGDVTISYNTKRNCTEYDEVSSILMDYKSSHLLGMTFKSFYLFMTKDHPVLMIDSAKTLPYRSTIDDIFMMRLSTKFVIYNRWFEPYDFNQKEEDVLWSARLAASFAKTQDPMPQEYKNKIWTIIQDLNGIQCQQWIEAFFTWNMPVGSRTWMRTVVLRNRDVRDMIFHVGPKAGLGVKHGQGWMYNRKSFIISVSSTEDITSSHLYNWMQERYTGSIFNISTRNGSFLARNRSGTFLCACDIKEE